MSTRIEHLDAEHPFLSLTVLTKGERTTDEERVTAPLALQVVGDDGAAIHGTPEQLVALLERALAGVREHLPAGPVLPDLTPGGDDDDAGCQHVWTAEEVEAIHQRHEKYRADTLANTGHDIGEYRHMPKVGALCGSDLSLGEEVTEYRRARRWENGTLIIGDTNHTEGGGDTSLTCDNGHAWAVPDIDYAP